MACDKCDFTSTSAQTVERHMKSNKHKGQSRSSNYNNASKCKILTPRKQKKTNYEPEPKTLFGVHEAIKLLEDT